MALWNPFVCPHMEDTIKRREIAKKKKKKKKKKKRKATNNRLIILENYQGQSVVFTFNEHLVYIRWWLFSFFPSWSAALFVM